MNKKIVIPVIVGLVIIACGSWFLLHTKETNIVQRETITNYPSSRETIVAFGDSLVRGIGSTKNHDFVSLLSQKIGEPIINLGVSGNSTAQGLARIDEVTSKKPKIVIVLLGGNDFLQNVLPNETFSNLEKIIAEIQKQGSIVVLLGIQGGATEDQDTYAKSFQDLAKKYHTAYIPNVLSGILDNSALMSDVVHPNDEGYKIIADKIYPSLNKLLK